MPPMMMRDSRSLRRLWDTVRWLRPSQVYGRLWFRAYRPRPDLRPAPPLRLRAGPWVDPAARAASMTGPDSFILLNQARDITSAPAWDSAAVPKLWRYHLHYFDDLNAAGAPARAGWHQALIERWLAENPPGRGTGWEPYPVSLRVVNWIKWARAGGALSSEARESLAVQARWLTKRLEWHLLGNHLVANAKALVFAGSFFAGREADGWLEAGLEILRVQLPEQVLADGGQFERSPMYHALAAEDLLDLLNAARAWPGRVDARLLSDFGERAQRMLHWLGGMCHPDGEIALFNDSAFGVAPTHAELFAYAARLELKVLPPTQPIEHFAASGYVRVEQGAFFALLDVGDIGPDYLPGHAHADSLSFELSFEGKRWIVDSGCSTYAVGAERLRQRGSAAHNTVVVDGQDSSEVWSSFRVAKRAKARGVSIITQEGKLVVSAAHDGYGRSAIVKRRWTVGKSSLRIEDRLEGDYERATGYLHLHPDVQAVARDAHTVSLTLAGRELTLRAEGASLGLAASTWHPGFNLSLPNTVVVATFQRPAASLHLELA